MFKTKVLHSCTTCIEKHSGEEIRKFQVRLAGGLPEKYQAGPFFSLGWVSVLQNPTKEGSTAQFHWWSDTLGSVALFWWHSQLHAHPHFPLLLDSYSFLWTLRCVSWHCFSLVWGKNPNLKQTRKTLTLISPQTGFSPISEGGFHLKTTF